LSSTISLTLPIYQNTYVFEELQTEGTKKPNIQYIRRDKTLEQLGVYLSENILTTSEIAINLFSKKRVLISSFEEMRTPI